MQPDSEEYSLYTSRKRVEVVYAVITISMNFKTVLEYKTF